MPEEKSSYSGGLFDWHKARLLPEAERPGGAAFVKGYGPNGEYTLLLPSPKIQRRIAFKDGAATVEFADTILKRPDIMALREKVLAGNVKIDVPSIIWADASLAEYSAALLLTQYRLTDDELTMLHSGEKWKDELVRHALGGDDVVEAMANLNPDWLTLIEESARRKREVIDSLLAYNMPKADLPQSDYIGEAPEETALEVQSALESGLAVADLIDDEPDDEDMLASD
jgi:hypothetical protein